MAAQLGISEDRARKLLDNPSSATLRDIRRKSAAPALFEGMDSMKLKSQRKGRDWRITSYEIEPGKGLPKTGKKYQVIAKGTVDGKARYITAESSKSPGGAYRNMVSMVGEYGGFEMDDASDLELLVYEEL